MSIRPCSPSGDPPNAAKPNASVGRANTTVVIGNDGMFSMQGKAEIGNIVRVGAMPEIGYAETSEQATEHVLKIAKS